jgi:hypothetical protein
MRLGGGKVYIPDVFFGALLTVAVFAMGMLFESSRKPPPSNEPKQATQQSGAPVSAQESPDRITDWLLVGLNFFLVCSTLLLWRANNRSARIAERTLTGLERPRILSVTPTFALIDEAIVTQIFVVNLGRDPGRVKEVHAKFIVGDLPAVPDFDGAQSVYPDLWLLPVGTYGPSPQRSAVGFPFSGSKAANFLAVKIRYEWDFGTHVHAFACNIVAVPKGETLPAGRDIHSVGGRVYNHDT